MMPPPPPPPPPLPPRPQAPSHFAPLPPPPTQSQPTNNTTNNVGGASQITKPPPEPPQQPSARFASYSTPSAPRYEPYGEVSVPTVTSSSTPAGLAHRRSNDIRNQPATALSATATAASTSGKTKPTQPYGYGQGVASSYAVPSRSYPQQENKKSERLTPKEMDATNSNQYQHNIACSCFLLPSLASILWWHESPVILQVFLFYALVVYAMDLMNTRDGMAVILWLGAPVMTMVSGFGTLLQAEDAEATGGAMILYLVQLAVEGLLFVSIVRIKVCDLYCIDMGSLHFIYCTHLNIHTISFLLLPPNSRVGERYNLSGYTERRRRLR